MKIKNHARLLLAFFAALTLSAIAAEPPAMDAAAPDFVLKTMDAKEVKLSAEAVVP